MKLTIIFAAILVALVAVRNLWLALDNRKEKLKLKDYRRELDSREIQLNLREIAIEQGLDAMKKRSEEASLGNRKIPGQFTPPMLLLNPTSSGTQPRS